MRRRIALIVVSVGLVGAIAVLLMRSEPPTSTSGTTSASNHGSVRGIRFPGLGSSKGLELDEMRGKPVVLNYWASWCPFCISEMPDFQDVYERVSEEVEFVGVNIQDDLSAARTLAKQTGVRYPLVSDPDGAIYRRLRGFSMPTTWFIDSEGRIVERFSGPLTAEQLGERITKHFGA